MPPVARYTLRRLLLAAVTLVGVVIAVFLMTHILPSDPAALRAGPLATEELIAQYRQEMGLDKSLVVQFLNYAALLARGDLGISWRTDQPVVEELGQRLPAQGCLRRSSLLVQGSGGAAFKGSEDPFDVRRSFTSSHQVCHKFGHSRPEIDENPNQAAGASKGDRPTQS